MKVDSVTPVLTGKVALVTGGANGIGAAAVQQFAAAGAQVMVADIDAAGVKRTVDALSRFGSSVQGVTVDVSNADSVREMVDATVRAFGRLDCAYNNAGIEHEHGPQLSFEQREAIWHRVLAVNLTGIWLSLQYEIRQMLKQGGGGAIVNCASVGGLRAIPTQDIYAVTKHGVVGATRVMAIEHAAAGIRVNAIAPGGIDTPMIDRALSKLPPEQVAPAKAAIGALHPMGRMGTPDEAARAAVWLCSDHASFCTGHVLAVDGGWLAK